MTVGFEVYNNSYRLQITSESRFPGLIQSGRVSAPMGAIYQSEVGYPNHGGSCPLVLLRPDPGSWVGGFRQHSNKFVLHVNGACDYAVFSSEVAPIVWGDGAGFQLFDGSGNRLWTTAHRYPRIQNIVEYFFPSGAGSTRVQIGTGVGLDPAGRRPWVDATDFTFSGESNTGGDGSAPNFFYTLEIPGNGGEAILGWRYSDDTSVIANWSLFSSKDIYKNRPIRLPMSYLPGV